MIEDVLLKLGHRLLGAPDTRYGHCEPTEEQGQHLDGGHGLTDSTG